MIYCHKHGQGLTMGGCQKCNDELITSLEEKIKELQEKLDEHTHLARTMGAISVRQMYNDYKALCDSRRNT